VISARARRLVEELHEVWDVRNRQEIAQRYLEEERASVTAAAEREPAEESSVAGRSDVGTSAAAVSIEPLACLDADATGTP